MIACSRAEDLAGECELVLDSWSVTVGFLLVQPASASGSPSSEQSLSSVSAAILSPTLVLLSSSFHSLFPLLPFAQLQEVWSGGGSKHNSSHWWSKSSACICHLLASRIRMALSGELPLFYRKSWVYRHWFRLLVVDMGGENRLLCWTKKSFTTCPRPRGREWEYNSVDWS